MTVDWFIPFRIALPLVRPIENGLVTEDALGRLDRSPVDESVGVLRSVDGDERIIVFLVSVFGRVVDVVDAEVTELEAPCLDGVLLC